MSAERPLTGAADTPTPLPNFEAWWVSSGARPWLAMDKGAARSAWLARQPEVDRLLREKEDALALFEATSTVLRTYAGHHSSCPECFGVWREVVALLSTGDAFDNPHSSSTNQGKEATSDER